MVSTLHRGRLRVVSERFLVKDVLLVYRLNKSFVSVAVNPRLSRFYQVEVNTVTYVDCCVSLPLQCLIFLDVRARHGFTLRRTDQVQVFDELYLHHTSASTN